MADTPVTSRFDPLKSAEGRPGIDRTARCALRDAREELGSIHEVLRVLSARERKAMEEMTTAEAELNALRRIVGYVRFSISALEKRIKELENQG